MLKKIRVEQLRLGMHIHEFCGSWLEHPFWRTKFMLTDPKDISLIRESSIRELWINIARGLDVEIVEDSSEDEPPAPPPEVMAAIDKPPIEKVPLAQEMQQAAKICAKAKEAVVSMFQEARMGKAIEAEQAQSLVEEISNSVLRNPGALISLARLKTADDYTYMHSVAVCALMIALARQLGLDEELTRELGMAGLLHDIGKMAMPLAVLNKPGKLTDEEFAIMKRHPEEGYRLLQSGKCISEIIVDVCIHHHEKMDGSGYPHGLNGEYLSLFAKMGAVCDVYDAITSNRPYKAGWDPAESIKRMAEWKGHFDPTIFQAFVKSLGIYPIGSFVRLESGRMGVVMEQTEKSLLTPRVKVFFSARSRSYITPEIIDLSRPSSNDRIVSREDAAKWGIKDVDRYWANEAKPA